MKDYCIKPGYTHRDSVPHFDDTPFKDEFQDEVYQYARQAYKGGGVIDLGCGSGFKLMKHFRYATTLGLELEPTLSFLRKTYPDRTWMMPGSQVPGGGALLICSDVIEHVEDPDQILDYMLAINPKCIVISTPDRDELQIDTQNGPPRNIHHVREWTCSEFLEYLSSRFVVEDHVQGKVTIVRMKPKER